MALAATQSSGGYSIGAVARLTGISTHTLRIWERRYSTVVADRTDTGRRVYNREHVEKLSLLKLLVDQGFSIGQIAGLTLEELRERHDEVAGQVSAMQERASDRMLRVAALARFSLNRLRQVNAPEQLDFVVIDNDYNRFRADVKRLGPDVLLLEYAVVDHDAIRQISDLRAVSGAQRIIVLFNFGHRRDIAELAASKVELMRSPMTIDALTATLRSGGAIAQPLRRQAPDEATDDHALRILDEDIPPRRFSESDLATLARIATSVDCECPHHLAELIQALTAFEVYSGQCEAKEDKDAALHHYLQGTTARARSLMEEGLDALVTAEKLLEQR